MTLSTLTRARARIGEPEPEHKHRRPQRRDFEGKTIARFRRDADNVWRFWFSDGTAFAIQSELFSGLPCMELCDECARPRRRATLGDDNATP